MTDENGMTRREFLSLTAGLGLMATSPSLLTGCGDSRGPAPLTNLTLNKHRVSSAWVQKDKHEKSSHLFKSMVENATDFSWLSGGDKVFLKLALNSGNPFPATTDPWALKCMIELLKEKGAGEIIVGDQSGVEHVLYTPGWGRGSSRECCRTAGLLAVMEEPGVTPCFFEENGYDAYRATYPTGSHLWKQPIYVTTAIDDVDHIINLPRVANHFMAGTTFGMKISVGFLRDDSRLVFHLNFGRFQEMYEEINHVPEIESKVRLTVTSGRAVMTTLGPDQGEIVRPDHGLIFASEDLLAHDLLAASWLEANRIEGNPKDIYSHPAIVHFMERLEQPLESIAWNRLNEHPDGSITGYMENLLRV